VITSKSGNSNSLTERKKQATSTTRTLQVVTYLAYSSLRNAAELQNKNSQNTKYRDTTDKKNNLNQLQMCKSQCRMKQ
jgi:D-arabinose 5-phosphate isomerase GutQ